MHETSFADSVRQARFVILGLELKPYSVGHELLLLSKRNALFSAREDFDKLPEHFQRNALIEAVLVCCQDWQANKKTHRWIGLWTWRQRKYNYKIGFADFRNYLASGSTGPEVLPADGPSGRTLGSPFHADVIQFLIQKLGKTETEAFDYPFGAAKFHYYTFAEKDGSIKIINREEFEFDEYCRIEDEKAAAKLKEEKCQPS